MDITFNTTTNLPVELEEFKKYIVETVGHRDSEITNLIAAATRRVEEHVCRSLADHEITLVCENKVSYQKLYYRPIEAISSVTDLSGDDLTYTTQAKPRSVTLLNPSAIEVTYTTKSSIDEATKQAIMDYATLLYNGSTDLKEFRDVLLKCYNPIM